MWAFAKAILLMSRFVRRVAIALEALVRLYKLDLESRGIYDTPPIKYTSDSPSDMAEISYTVKDSDPHEYQQ